MLKAAYLANWSESIQLSFHNSPRGSERPNLGKIRLGKKENLVSC